MSGRTRSGGTRAEDGGHANLRRAVLVGCLGYVVGLVLTLFDEFGFEDSIVLVEAMLRDPIDLLEYAFVRYETGHFGAILSHSDWQVDRYLDLVAAHPGQYILPIVVLVVSGLYLSTVDAVSDDIRRRIRTLAALGAGYTLVPLSLILLITGGQLRLIFAWELIVVGGIYPGIFAGAGLVFGETLRGRAGQMGPASRPSERDRSDASAVKTVAEDLACPECGERAGRGTFCPHCGADL